MLENTRQHERESGAGLIKNRVSKNLHIERQTPTPPNQPPFPVHLPEWYQPRLYLLGRKKKPTQTKHLSRETEWSQREKVTRTDIFRSLKSLGSLPKCLTVVRPVYAHRTLVRSVIFQFHMRGQSWVSIHWKKASSMKYRD